MAKKVEELAPAPPLPGAPHTVHTDELLKALGANAERGFTDAQAKDLQACVLLVPPISQRLGLFADPRDAAPSKYGPNQLKPPEKPSVRPVGAPVVLEQLDLNLADALRALPSSPLPPSQPWKLLGRQIANAMTIVLIASMAVSFGTQDWIAGAVILALVVLNVTVGFSQEWKAEKTVAALASVGSPTAVVVRDGNSKTLAVEEVVP